MNDKTPQTIDQLQDRYEALLKKKQLADTEFTAAAERLKVAQEQARKTYGTDDIEKLTAMLSEWTAENDKLRRDYEASLDQIEDRLRAIQTGAEGTE